MRKNAGGSQLDPFRPHPEEPREARRLEGRGRGAQIGRLSAHRERERAGGSIAELDPRGELLQLQSYLQPKQRRVCASCWFTPRYNCLQPLFVLVSHLTPLRVRLYVVKQQNSIHRVLARWCGPAVTGPDAGGRIAFGAANGSFAAADRRLSAQTI